MRHSASFVLSSILIAAACGGRTELDTLTENIIGGSLPRGDTVATGGTYGGAPSTGGTTSAAGSLGSGCTGSFEEIQNSTGLCVTKMVPITAPSSTDDYSIDATEVTQGQYHAWLAHNPALPASADANCSYVTSYVEQSTGGIYTVTDATHDPVVFVDWCDAYVYCKGVGKRLCGAIGGGTNAYASYTDATLSQWYRACSSGGVDTYPYGNTYQATACDGYDYWIDNSSTSQPMSVGSLANCVTSTTGYAGAYDLSGNVWEWEDSCSSTGSSAGCLVRGGAFNYGSSSNLTCGGGGSDARNYVSNDLGFRCCSP